jgi:hypothetical protein
MCSELVLFPIIFTISCITFFAIYFLRREYSIAKKMLGISAAKKCLQKKIFPFSLLGILMTSTSLPAYFYLPEKLISIYMVTLFNLFFCLLFLVKFADFASSKSSSIRMIFEYVNKKEKEKNFSLFAASLSSSTVIVLLVFSEKTIIFPGIYFISMNLCLGLHYLILSFNSLKIVENGIIYNFRLMKWNNIHAYTNILNSLDWDRNSVFKITLRLKPSILHMSSFVQIPVNSQDIDSINQILAERLPGKKI